MTSNIETIQNDLQQINRDLEAFDRVRRLMENQRLAMQDALRDARAAEAAVAPAESPVEPETTEAGPRHAQESDVTQIPPVSIRVNAFQGRTLWLIDQDRAAHVRVPSPSAGGVLCGLDGKDLRPFTPDLSGYVWTCGDCYQVMRAQS